MRLDKIKCLGGWLVGGLLVSSPSWAATQDADADALALESAPVEAPKAAPNLKLAAELSLGRARLRQAADDETLRRASLDLVYTARLAPQWRAVLSDRLDSQHPNDGEATVNSLRELYAGWQDEAGRWAVDFGRVNLRQGPALGFNPTDFFRDGALRVSTTVNPLLVREYRMGSVMARLQRLWPSGSASLAISPKLSDAPSHSGFSADLGATNNRNRALASLGTQWSEKVNSQLHWHVQQDGKPQWGASGTALVTDALVLHGEASWAREPSLLSRITGAGGEARTVRYALGAAYTTGSRLTATVELQHNGAAMTEGQWDALAASQPWLLGAYLREADRRQDIAARRALLLHARQVDAFVKNLDLTAMVRLNLQDHSSLRWLEARYHWGALDLSLQWQEYHGKALSEFGLPPYRRSLQAAGTYYF